MKKFVLALMLVGVFSAFAEDLMNGSYLCWMVGENGVVTTTDGRSVGDYTSVKVKAVGGSTGTDSGYLTIGWNNEGVWTPLSNQDGAYAVTPTEMGGASFYASLGNFGSAAYGYVIELWNDTGLQAFSETLSYDAATAYIATFNNTGLSELMSSTWAPHSYTVPEPNSALLLMLGLAGLALRRRQMKA